MLKERNMVLAVLVVAALFANGATPGTALAQRQQFQSRRTHLLSERSRSSSCCF
jgi:hypothetical protein